MKRDAHISRAIGDGCLVRFAALLAQRSEGPI
jgi:hypothetical protein